MVEGNGAVTLDARRARLGRPNCVLNMVEAYDAPIVSHGLTHDVVQKIMMATARPVSNISFQRTHEVKSFMPIPKRCVFVMRSMNSLKVLSTTNPSIQGIVTAPCDAALITENLSEPLFYAWKRMSLLIEDMIPLMKRSDTTISIWFTAENGSLFGSILMARE
jgi:hypothetical protein